MDLTTLDPKTALIVTALLAVARLLSVRFPVLGVLLRLFAPAPLPARTPATPEPAPNPTPANPARPLLPVLMPLDRLRAIRDGLNARLELAEADAAQRQREAEALETILKGIEQAKPPEKGVQ